MSILAHCSSARLSYRTSPKGSEMDLIPDAARRSTFGRRSNVRCWRFSDIVEGLNLTHAAVGQFHYRIVSHLGQKLATKLSWLIKLRSAASQRGCRALTADQNLQLMRHKRRGAGEVDA
jgi:hypothetical protein